MININIHLAKIERDRLKKESKTEIVRNYYGDRGCGCATMDDCERRGCASKQSCGCARIDDCERRGH